MLMTLTKSKEAIVSQVKGKAFIIDCHGCKEISTKQTEADVVQLITDLCSELDVTGTWVTNYVCNPENFMHRMKAYEAEIENADTIILLSCGVGVQTVSSLLENKRVIAACDTYPLPGFQGVTPLEYDCKQCGECFLNLTGGICPITACSKSLVNGQCGGSKNGKCEVDPDMECGWERIYRRLEKIGRLDALKCPVQVRNYATDDEVNKQ